LRLSRFSLFLHNGMLPGEGLLRQCQKHNQIMETTRQNKIARLLQKELSGIFEQQTRLTHGIIVSVSKCRISPDLSICTSYLSVFPSEKAAEIVANISANARSIRYELGKRVRFQLRIIPELRFYVDDSLDYIQHIDELLGK
jgi:ribosome-binding factor A